MSTSSTDPTRKQRREEAREQRRAAEVAAQAQATRRKRLLQVGGALGAAIVVVVVAIIVSSGGGGSKATGLQSNHQANATVSQVSSLLNGIPQSGNALGSPSAPVTLLYYGDLECPICQQFTLTTFPQVVTNLVRSGKVRVEFHSLETATPDKPTFDSQQVAALAAGQQGRMWQFVELFYHEQGQEGSGYVTPSYLTGLAKQVPGLNLSQWTTARNESTLSQQVSSDQQTISSEGLQNETPTLIFKGPKGTKAAQQALTYAQVQQVLQSVS